MAKALGLMEQARRNGVKAFRRGKLNGLGARTVTPEEMELSRRRADVLRLQNPFQSLCRCYAWLTGHGTPDCPIDPVPAPCHSGNCRSD